MSGGRITQVNVTLFVFNTRDKLTSTEDVTAAIAAAGELGIIAVAAVDLVELGAELFIHQRDPALRAQETCFMPVLVFVRQILKEH